MSLWSRSSPSAGTGPPIGSPVRLNRTPPQPLSTWALPRAAQGSDANGGRIRSSKGGTFGTSGDGAERSHGPRFLVEDIYPRRRRRPLSDQAHCRRAHRSLGRPAARRARPAGRRVAVAQGNARPNGSASRCAWPATTAGTASSPRPSRAAISSRSKPGPTSSPPGAWITAQARGRPDLTLEAQEGRELLGGLKLAMRPSSGHRAGRREFDRVRRSSPAVR